MIIYKELITGDELFTDSYKLREVDEGIFIEVEGKLTTESTVVDDSMIGGNRSAEATGEEDAENSSVSGVNIVIQNRLSELGVDKKKYKTYIKLYIKHLMKHIQETKPDYLPAFKKHANDAVARILKNFDDWAFYRGETDIDYENADRAEGMLAILGYREDGVTPYMLFFKDGLIEEKAACTQPEFLDTVALRSK